MLRILERDYSQTLEEMVKEFPNCRILSNIKDLNSGKGFLLALSDSIESDSELTKYIMGVDIENLGIAGFYAEELEDDVAY